MNTNVKFFSFVVILIIVAGMYIVMTGMGVHLPTGQQCYDQLNAAGQVVGTFCQ